MLLGNEADTTAYFGQLGKARELSRQADSSATQSQQRETAALHEAAAAIREALFGNAGEARKWAASTKQLWNSRDVQYGASLALALTGDFSQGETRLEQLADDFARRFPEDTLVEFNYLPTLRAQIAIDHHDPSKAIELLQAAAPYELGSTGGSVSILPCIPSMSEERPTCCCIRAAKQPPSFKKSSTIAGLCGTSPSAHWHTWQLGRALRDGRRHRQSQVCVQRFPHALERRRPRHPHPEASQSRVREAEVAAGSKNRPPRRHCSPMIGTKGSSMNA